MAARPNTVRTLEYGHRLAVNHTVRLRETIAMAERVIAENHLLTKEDVASYKECVSIAKRQLAFFEKATALAIPSVKLSTRRKRGRPSKSELETLEAQRKGRSAKASKTAAKAAPAKAAKAKAKTAKSAAPVATAKRRGRPPKAASAAAAPVKGKPGRKPKAAKEQIGGIDVSKLSSDQKKALTAVLASTPQAKRRGRPPKPRDSNGVIMNGANGHGVASESAPANTAEA